MWFDGFFPEYTYNPYNWSYLGAGIYPSSAASGLPGEWYVEVHRNSGGFDTLLTSATFYLIDDVSPSVSFVSPTDGGDIQNRQDVSIHATDNVKVTHVEVTAFDVATGQSYPLADLTSTDRDGNYSFTWSTRNLPLSEYVLYAKAYDPYGNWGDAAIDVISSPEVGVVMMNALDSVQLPGVSNPVFQAALAYPDCDLSTIKQLPIGTNPNDSFNLEVILDACPMKPDWNPVVEWKYSVLGNSDSGSFTGWTGTIPISTVVRDITDRTYGDQKLSLTFVIKDPNTGHTLKRQTESLAVRIVPNIIPITMGRTKQLTATPDATGSGLIIQEGAADPSLEWSILSGDNGQIDDTGVFRAIYISRPYRTCFIKVTDGTNTGYAVMDVKRPDSLGSAPNAFDDAIIDNADRYGVPPQLIKAQIHQESTGYFNPQAYRYEPRYDWERISIGAAKRARYLLTTAPYSYYRIAVPAENGYTALAQGALLDPSDISPRNMYSLVDSNSNGYYSAWELINANPSQWPNNRPPTTVDFTAQTTIASSYGLMQIMWPTALNPLKWNGGAGGQPHLLFDPALNIELGVSYDKTNYNDTGNWDQDWEDAIGFYNVYDPNYANRVLSHEPLYMPLPVY